MCAWLMQLSVCGGTIVARAEARADLHVGAHHLRQPAHVQARPSVTIYVLILLVVFGLFEQIEI